MFGAVIDAVARRDGRYPNPDHRIANPYGTLATSETDPTHAGHRVYYELPNRALQELDEYLRARRIYNPSGLAPSTPSPYPSGSATMERRGQMTERQVEMKKLRQGLEKIQKSLFEKHGGKCILYAEDGRVQEFFPSLEMAAMEGLRRYGQKEAWIATDLGRTLGPRLRR